MVVFQNNGILEWYSVMVQNDPWQARAGCFETEAESGGRMAVQHKQYNLKGNFNEIYDLCGRTAGLCTFNSYSCQALPASQSDH